MKNTIFNLLFFKRILLISFYYPKIIFPLILYVISKVIPFVNFKTIYIENKFQLKQDDIRKQKNIGNARGERVYKLSLLKLDIISIKTQEGNEATALQFFIFRPTNDIEYLIKNVINDNLRLTKHTTIFEPGCGTGRHLTYLNDKYNCRVFGVDSYSPCIKIANLIKGKKNNKVNFKNISALDIYEVDKFIPDRIDLIYINSWLNHVFHLNNYFDFIKFISSRTKFLAVISNSKYLLRLDDYLPNFSRIKEITIDNTSYLIYKSNIL